MSSDTRSGRIITFYSYKGGTGRSMAVANIAWILASNSMRVLVIDWDLEAPGLHRYFSPFLIDKNLEDTEGLIDFVTDFALEAMSLPKEDTKVSDDWYLTHANIIDYAVSLEWQFPTGGAIDFVPSGRQGPSYARRFSSFNWQNFYEQMGGGVFLEAAKRQMRAEYDYVLIDSRTGVSDTAGICTVQMPDTLVVCFTLNNQSSYGAANIARSVFNQRRAADDGFRIYPVPMRVDPFEKEKLDRRRRYAQRLFRPFLQETMEFDVDSYWPQIEIPYIPHLAYEEVLTPFVENPNDPKSALSALGRLTKFITDGAVTQIHFPISPVEQQQVLLAFSESPGDFDDDQANEGPSTLDVEDLIKTAEAEYGRLSSNEQSFAREVWSRLVRVGHLNTEIAYEAVRADRRDFDGLDSTFIGRFIDAGLLKRAKDELTDEISFEATNAHFLKQWHRLQQWTKEDAEFLLWRQVTRKLVQIWEQSERNVDYLLRGASLKTALSWSGQFGARLNPHETSFIQRSRTVDKGEERWWWWKVVTSLTLFIGILAFSVYFLVSQKDNYKEKLKNEKQAIHDNYRGMEQLKAGNIQEAIESFRASLKRDEDYYDPLYNLGTAYLKAENYSAAQNTFASLKYKYKRVAAYIGLARSFEGLGKLTEANGNSEDAKKYYDGGLMTLAELEAPNVVDDSTSLQLEVKYVQGLINYDKKEYGIAISNFSEAIKIKPDYAEALLERGKAYAQITAYDMALDDLKNAISKSQDSSLINEATSLIQDINTKRRVAGSTSK